MITLFDLLRVMDSYYSSVSADWATSSYKKYYGDKMIDLMEEYSDLKEYWAYHENQYCWKDRFEKIKIPTKKEEKALKKVVYTTSTFYIYFAHSWDFNCNYSSHTIKEMVDSFMKYRNYSESEARKSAKEYLDVKIGLTTNINQRNTTLYNAEGVEIKQYFAFKGNYNQALWMESQMRLYIEQHYSSFNCSHYGNDHFHCMNTNIIRHIDKTFTSVCERMFEQMALVK